MEQNMTIRPERESDYPQVEDIIRQAFYNLYTPGCTEHYLAHVIRPHPDFLPELDLVLELDGRVVGSIMYTKSTLADEAGQEKGILTFGPVCIQPGYQRRGLGQAADGGVLPAGGRHGVRGHRDLRRSQQLCGPRLPKLQKAPGPSGGRDVSRRHAGEGAAARAPWRESSWIYRQSPAFAFDEEAARRFDDSAGAHGEKAPALSGGL